MRQFREEARETREQVRRGEKLWARLWKMGILRGRGLMWRRRRSR